MMFSHFSSFCVEYFRRYRYRDVFSKSGRAETKRSRATSINQSPVNDQQQTINNELRYCIVSHERYHPLVPVDELPPYYQTNFYCSFNQYPYKWRFCEVLHITKHMLLTQVQESESTTRKIKKLSNTQYVW
jgi:hypothetical protein